MCSGCGTTDQWRAFAGHEENQGFRAQQVKYRLVECWGISRTIDRKAFNPIFILAIEVRAALGTEIDRHASGFSSANEGSEMLFQADARKRRFLAGIKTSEKEVEAHCGSLSDSIRPWDAQVYILVP